MKAVVFRGVGNVALETVPTLNFINPGCDCSHYLMQSPPLHAGNDRAGTQRHRSPGTVPHTERANAVRHRHLSLVRGA